MQVFTATSCTTVTIKMLNLKHFCFHYRTIYIWTKLYLDTVPNIVCPSNFYTRGINNFKCALYQVYWN